MIQFFIEVKNELLKVVWPTWKETIYYTVAIIFLSLVIAFILGAADLGLLKLFESFIKKF